MAAVKKMRLVPYVTPPVNTAETNTVPVKHEVELNALDTAMSHILENDSLSDTQKIAKYTETMQSHLSGIGENTLHSIPPTLAVTDRESENEKGFPPAPERKKKKVLTRVPKVKALTGSKVLARKKSNEKQRKDKSLKLDFSKRWLQWNDKV
jgi:hypothetical protein